MTSSFLVYGGGGHAKVVIEAAQDIGISTLGFFVEGDLGFSLNQDGVSFLGEYSDDNRPDLPMIIAIGNNSARKRLASLVKRKFLSIIHRSSIVSMNTVIGQGTVILHGAIVQAGTCVGSHVIINSGAIVDHDCVVDDFSHIAPGAVLCGGVKVGKGSLIGAGARVIPDITIGDNCVIGAGAVVVSNISNNSKVIGIPARAISK